MLIRVISGISAPPSLGLHSCHFKLKTGDRFQLERFEREVLLFGDDDRVIGAEPKEWARVKINGLTVLEHVFPGALAIHDDGAGNLRRMPDSFSA